MITLVIFLISTWSLAFYVSQRLRDDIQVLLGKQQLATASFRADEVNRALNEQLGTLGRIAALLDRETLADRQALAAFLDGRPVLHGLFNGGLSVFDASGTMIGGTLPAGGRHGVNGNDQPDVAAGDRTGHRRHRRHRQPS